MSHDFQRIPLKDAIEKNYIDFMVSHSYSEIKNPEISDKSILKIFKDLGDVEEGMLIDLSTPHYDKGMFIVSPIMKENISENTSNLIIPDISIKGMESSFNSTLSQDKHSVSEKDNIVDSVIDIISKEIYSQMIFFLNEDAEKKASFFGKIKRDFISGKHESSFINDTFQDIFSARDKIHNFVKDHIISLNCRDILISRIISEPIYAIHKKQESVELCDITHSGFYEFRGIYYAKYDVVHRDSGHKDVIVPLITSFKKSSIASSSKFIYFETKDHLLSSSFDIDIDRINSL